MNTPTSTKRVLICGSIAFDTIMVFEGRFKDQILPDQVHILNVAFLVPSLRKDWGGCAGNIAYSLNMLGGKPVPMATIGHDAGGYFQRLQTLGIDTACLKQVQEEFTAQAFITTDLDDNQITAFHPGAMSHSHLNKISDAGDIALGIIAPDGRDGMMQHAEQFAAAGIQFVFDPGQGLPMFGKTELDRFLELATFAAVNDYEAKMLCERTGLTLEQIADKLEALVVTRGAEGSWVYTQGQRHDIPCVKAEQIADPTGCGDAYRGGLLYGLIEGLGIVNAAKLASLMGSLKIAAKGPQTYQYSREEIASRFAAAFGHQPW
ncbi:MAG: carbohydrate kinase family protein [Gammaproteobacteria bacterium]|nr:carbohydrate kinase family protein [Gammaproteobacteria bacterium]MBU0848705.1 carbohydrate kinase family protein [Gammaproteobacteria bacterium]MBU1268465.1 carbohydrate kinase family protein [Gammaproteobacteria bacterium]MBU1528764.1 carbohydrate kinase family protein [Gammaproteobacteria bacterium]MBU1779085.1 carbohydrate kinase family protein [Gammaproteobacteria bacterium]